MTIDISKLARRAGVLLSVATVAGVVSCSDVGTGPDTSTNSTNSTNPSNPTISTAEDLATGAHYACLLTTIGQTWCWGDDTFGTLGDGGSTASNVPIRVTGVPSFIQLSASDDSVCGLTASGQVWCWGDLPEGYPFTISRRPKQQPSAPSRLVSISVGLGFVCGLDSSGAAYCWGSNIFGQLAVGDTLARGTPTHIAPGITFTSISTSAISMCGLASGGIAMCAGYNAFQHLGTGAALNAQVRTLQPVTGGHVFSSLAAGTAATCGLTADGTAYCWGFDQFGEAGSPPSAPPQIVNLPAPTSVATAARFNTFVPGHANLIEQFSCGVAQDGTGYCSGYNGTGQVGASSGSFCSLGPGNLQNMPCTVVPTAVAGLGPVKTISLGTDFACAITTTKRVVCWGNNVNGQLGDGTFAGRPTPAAIQGTFAQP